MQIPAEVQLDLVAGKLILTIPVEVIGRAVPEPGTFIMPKLSEQERKVLDLLRKRLGNKEIAYKLNIATSTAKFHVSALISKFGVSSRGEVVDLVGALPEIKQNIPKIFPPWKKVVASKPRKVNKDTEVFPLNTYSVNI